MTSRLAGCAAALGAMLLVSACAGDVTPLHARTIAAVAPRAAATVEVTWLGTAGVRIDDGWTALLIDPFVTRVGVGAVVFGRGLTTDEVAARAVDTTDVAAVLVTHSHYDHLVDAPWFAATAGAELLGSRSTINVGRASGLPAVQLHEVVVGQPRVYGEFTVTFVESLHGPAFAGRVPFPGAIDEDVKLPASASEYRMGGAFGVIVQHPAGTIVHHASASWLDGMYDGVEADVVLLGLAGRDHTIDYLSHVVDATGATRVVPIHWDNFFRPLDRPLKPIRAAKVDEFFDTVTALRPDLSIETLPVNRSRVLLTGD
jgi:L-ascorbate metabolism protein UlaG (beta-lactamase superfamily)